MTARKPLVLVGGAPAQLPAGDTLENTVRTDLSQTFTAPQRAAYATLTDAATITVNLATALNFTVTLGGNRSVDAPSNPVAGQSGTIEIHQDATGGRTLAWNTAWKWEGGAPALSTAANAVDHVGYLVESNGSTVVAWMGVKGRA